MNRAFASKYFDGQSPIGRRISRGPESAMDIEIVGLVEDSVFGGPAGAPQPQIFFSHFQSRSFSNVTYYVRTSLRPEAMFEALRQEARKVNPEAPVWNMRTLRSQLNAVIAPQRLLALLSTAFGGFATLLTAVGLYGVLAFVVARRTGEIGLRVALGARRPHVMWLVGREVLLMVAAGVVLGVPAAIGARRLLSGVLRPLLFRSNNASEWTAAALAMALLAGGAVVAGLIPARRASAIDPVRALRQE